MNTKKINHFFLKLLVLLILMLTSFVVLRHNASWYQDSIGEVTSVKQVSSKTLQDQYGNKVTQHHQKVSVKLLNTQNKGKTVSFINSYDDAQAITQPLNKHDQIFLAKSEKAWGFKNFKRDSFWIPILIMVMGLLIISMGKAGSFMILSLIINVILFIGTIYLNFVTKEANIFWLFILFSIVASMLTLIFVMGIKSRLTWTVLLTVITSTTAAMLIGLLVFNVTNGKGLHFELISFITQLPQPMFLSMTLVGVLGAVMDEATDMIATLFSLEREHPEIGIKELLITGRHVGQEIFGALSNTLFLIFIAEQIPMAILYLRNGNNWGFTYTMNLSLGMVQTLISAIGIVLTVPAGIFWVWILHKWRQKKMGAKI
ncbi:YibE/F family protein [Weissella hellenica]|nr:YibE/F family protein [Weissella hellenica]